MKSITTFIPGRRAPFFLAALFAAASTGAYAQPDGVEDPVMGLYEGVWSTTDGQKGIFSAQIRPLGNESYDGFVTFKQEGEKLIIVRWEPSEPADNGIVTLAGDHLEETITGAPLRAVSAEATIEDGIIRGIGSRSGERMGNFAGVRVVNEPSNLGASPPDGAVVLFNGEPTDRWESFHFEVTDEGAMRVQGGDLHATDRFDNYTLHVEFRLPYEPEARGQGRGNGGVYLQSIYEVQVLDSFGVYPLGTGDAAGIYVVRPPSTNATLPPMQWQTYEITFRQEDPEHDGLPSVTVILNGEKVHDRVAIPEERVEGGTGGGTAGGGFLKLQDHGNPVEFRNIWVLPE